MTGSTSIKDKQKLNLDSAKSSRCSRDILKRYCKLVRERTTTSSSSEINNQSFIPITVKERISADSEEENKSNRKDENESCEGIIENEMRCNEGSNKEKPRRKTSSESTEILKDIPDLEKDMIDNSFDSEKIFEANHTYFLMIGAEMASKKNIEKFNVEKSMDEDVLNENPEGETTIKYESSSNAKNDNHLSDELNSLFDINGVSNATNSNFSPASEGGNN